jgi:hypothetical protein
MSRAGGLLLNGVVVRVRHSAAARGHGLQFGERLADAAPAQRRGQRRELISSRSRSSAFVAMMAWRCMA